MKSSQLIANISNALGIEQSAVQFAARKLREAGFLTTGARGLNAPDMTTLDAARLTLALMTGAPPTRIVETFSIYRKFKNDEFAVVGDSNFIQELGLKKEDTAEIFLTLLLDFFTSNPVMPNLGVISSDFLFEVHQRPAYVIFKSHRLDLDVYFTPEAVPNSFAAIFSNGQTTQQAKQHLIGIFDESGLHVTHQIGFFEIDKISSKFKEKDKGNKSGEEM